MKVVSEFIWVFLIGIIGMALFIPRVTQNHSMTKNSFDLEPIFSVHLIEPTSSPVRKLNSQVIVEEFPKIGINAELDLISWAAFGPRCTDEEVGTYDEGGYDICFFGMSLGPPIRHPGASMKEVYGADAIPPAGYNVMYWAPGTDSVGRSYMTYRVNESNQLIKEINNNWNLTETKEDLKTWQKIWYDVMPNILIYNQYEVHAISTGLYGYDPIAITPRQISYINPSSYWESIWTTNDYTGTIGEVVLASSTRGDSFNPLIAHDVYAQYSSVPITDGLLGFTSSKKLNLPFGINRSQWMLDNFGTTEYLKLYTRIADGMGTFSADGLQYNISVRDDVLWHDDHLLDAWDVAFSFQARMIPYSYYNGRPRYYGGYGFYNDEWLKPFGYENKTIHSGNYSFIVEDKDSNGFYEHISFQLNQTCVEFETDYLISPILPEHILGDPKNHGFSESGDFDPSNHWLVPINEWNSHSYNTANPTDPSGYKGPIGCGSLIFKEYDPTEGIVFLEKFENIRWDNSTGAWVNDTQNKHFLVKDGKLSQMPTKATIIVASRDSSFTDMKTGKVNIIDPQFTMAHIIDELQAETTVQPILSVESAWQAMYFNPKFEQDGVYHLNKKGVRHAISHIVPRQAIVESLLNGLACPAYTPLPQNSWAALPEKDLITYKQSLLATDGTTPEEGETTAYDSYNISLALDWLDTEGYDVSDWRNITTISSNPPNGISSHINSLLTLLSNYPNILFGGFLLTSISIFLVYLRRHKKTLD